MNELESLINDQLSVMIYIFQYLILLFILIFFAIVAFKLISRVRNKGALKDRLAFDLIVLGGLSCLYVYFFHYYIVVALVLALAASYPLILVYAITDAMIRRSN